MKLALIVIGSVLAVVAGLAGTVYGVTSAFDSTKTEDHSFDERVEHIVIEADSGDVELVQGTGKTVEVTEKRHYFVDSPEMEREVEDGVLTLKGECDGVASWFCETDYRVEVPEGVTVKVETHVGDIEANGIDARSIEARTNVGDIDVDASRKADVKARTNVGNIDVAMPSGTYDVHIDTNVGSSDADGLVDYDQAKYRVSADSDVGDVEVSAR